MKLHDDIAKRLRDSRIKRGYTISKMSHMANVATTTYYQHERSLRKIKVHHLIIYSALLNIDIDWLLTGQD